MGIRNSKIHDPRLTRYYDYFFQRTRPCAHTCLTCTAQDVLASAATHVRDMQKDNIQKSEVQSIGDTYTYLYCCIRVHTLARIYVHRKTCSTWTWTAYDPNTHTHIHAHTHIHTHLYIHKHIIHEHMHEHRHTDRLSARVHSLPPSGEAGNR